MVIYARQKRQYSGEPPRSVHFQYFPHSITLDSTHSDAEFSFFLMSLVHAWQKFRAWHWPLHHQASWSRHQYKTQPRHERVNVKMENSDFLVEDQIYKELALQPRVQACLNTVNRVEGGVFEQRKREHVQDVVFS